MTVSRAVPHLDPSMVDQLESECAGRFAPGVVHDALVEAARDLEGSIRSDALPQMAFVLARYRLNRDEEAGE
ncbi:hypothetical protein SAMN04515671_3973 [Nakamurella panacisegetis]|uniref:Uncharacterized protein n=1 Tax=Nakamurella panacisegetis TaxID=1090615 RepID=A0A1H0SA48_9ACTN|nr:hypothetical protein [Nakamurella panacisegetis]SDP38379.1 hypothetical protein SAMN04515671_3973 [Nakamurella panacisegetis]